MNTLEKWNPFKGSSLWDPIREMEEMQNRLFGRRLALKKDAGEEALTVAEWLPAVDIAEDDKEHNQSRIARREQRGRPGECGRGCAFDQRRAQGGKGGEKQEVPPHRTHLWELRSEFHAS
jgi:hypothetical protein